MKMDILDSYEKVSLDYFGNSNSLHKLGLNSKKIEEAASKQILTVLGLDICDYEVIYTSGNAESFTMLINNYKDSIWSCNDEFLNVCNLMGVSILDEKSDAKFTSSLDGEIYGSRYKHIDVKLSKKYDNLCLFDFITIEDDIPFFGVLIKKKNIDIISLIDGGKSSTKYRSGTASTPLIISFSKLVRSKYNK